MQKSLFILFTTLFLLGCGGAEEKRSFGDDTNKTLSEDILVDETKHPEDINDSNEKDEETPPLIDSQVCVNKYYQKNILATLNNRCLSCHTNVKRDPNTSFILSFDELANQELLADYMIKFPNKLIEKNDGTLTHGGLKNFDDDLSNKFNLFSTYTGDTSLCVDEITAPVDVNEPTEIDEEVTPPEDSNDSSETDDEEIPPLTGSQTCVDEFYTQNIVGSLTNTCYSCHSKDGLASTSPLVLHDFDSVDASKNQQLLVEYMIENPNKLIQKNNGTLDHDGEENFDESLSTTFDTFFTYSTNVSLCLNEEDSQLPEVSLAQVKYLNNETFLRNSALKLLGRAPTAEELSASVKESALEGVIQSYLNEEAFYNWLKIALNDRFLTDFYLKNLTGMSLAWGYDSQWYYTIPQYDKDADDKTYFYDIREKINYGVARAPIELIVDLIKNDDDFAKILTADYTLVNPYSARTYGLTPETLDIYGNPLGDFIYQNDMNKDEVSHFAFKKVRRKTPSNYYYGGLDIPHAGILTDKMFLNKYSTTKTNRNRGRSEKFQKFFLDTEILRLSNRPIDSNKAESVGGVPTMENSSCTVCHYQMDPIAALFQNQDGSYYKPVEGGWYDIKEGNHFLAGFNLTQPIEDGNRTRALQWLAEKTVNDPRFSMSMVKMFYKMVTASEPLYHPEPQSADYAKKLQAYNFQRSLFNEYALAFRQSGNNAKVLIQKIIFSPYFRGTDIALEEENSHLNQNIALSHLLTPLELHNRIKSTTGYYFATRRQQELEDPSGFLTYGGYYKILYGGIDSVNVTKRLTELNGVMSAVAKRMSYDTSCEPVSWDFVKPASRRNLFPLVERDDLPTNDEGIKNIKLNIQHLHKQLLNEDLSLDDPEIAFTYELFKGVYDDFHANNYPTFMAQCGAVVEYGVAEANLGADTDNIVRTWAAVVNYLLNDFKMLYDTRAK